MAAKSHAVSFVAVPILSSTEEHHRRNLLSFFLFLVVSNTLSSTQAFGQERHGTARALLVASFFGVASRPRMPVFLEVVNDLQLSPRRGEAVADQRGKARGNGKSTAEKERKEK